MVSLDFTQCFTPLEETVSFYTRNDFAIMNSLLLCRYERVWENARLAYKDNQGIISEYESGVRTVSGEYDIKWLNALRKRLIDKLDDRAKEKIIAFARQDIINLLQAMAPTASDLSLYRTAWIDSNFDTSTTYPFSDAYKALELRVGGLLEIQTITSCAHTPYREDENVGSDFYRYEIHVPQGLPVLELNQFRTHNEDGEVLLPPMKCRVTDIIHQQNGFRRGIIKLVYMEAIEPLVDLNY